MKPKLLVLELWGIGDLAIAVPFLRAAVELFEVTLVGKPHASQVLERFCPAVKVIPFVAPWTAFRGKYRLLHWPWRELLQLRRTLAQMRFDIGASGRWDPRDHLLLAFSGARRRLGFPRRGSANFLTQPLDLPPAEAHRYENWRVVGKALGLSLPDRKSIPVPPNRSGAILIHTGAGQPVRVWPLDRFSRIVRRLRDLGFVVQLVCDNDQRAAWSALGEADAVAPDSVAQLLSLLNGAAVFIGCDSGSGHVAALSGVPTFTLFGPQVPENFVPLHPEAEWVAGPICPHRPCWDDCHFPVPHCLHDLSEAAVWARVEAFVGRHAGRLRTCRT